MAQLRRYCPWFRSQSKRRLCSKFRFGPSSHCHGNKVGCNMGTDKSTRESTFPAVVLNQRGTGADGWIPPVSLSLSRQYKCIPGSSLRVSSGTQPQLPTVVTHLLKHLLFVCLFYSLPCLISPLFTVLDGIPSKINQSFQILVLTSAFRSTRSKTKLVVSGIQWGRGNGMRWSEEAGRIVLGCIVLHFLFDSQCCANLCCTAKWLSYTRTHSFCSVLKARI